GRDRFAGERDGGGPHVVEQAEFVVDRRRRLLDQGRGTDELLRHGQAADLEVVDGALGLRPVQGSRRHVDLAQAVVLDAIWLFRHDRPPAAGTGLRGMISSRSCSGGDCMYTTTSSASD